VCSECFGPSETERLRTENAALRERVAELEKRLNFSLHGAAMALEAGRDG
jgi:BMFP domain-containing protein YqiC